MNTSDQLFDQGLALAEEKVLGMQVKLHRWAREDDSRRFDDLHNLVYDPAFMAVAWDRVRTNKGARTAGVDGWAPNAIAPAWVAVMLEETALALRQRRYHPQPTRTMMIPKPGGKMRRLGIPTARDRVVQAVLKLVLEPIFEADFDASSYGFRPMRGTKDAIAEIHYLASGTRQFDWVFEADITACFDQIDHGALITRIARRIKDKRILELIRAFLKAGCMNNGIQEETLAGTPQGGILSPLLANIALSALDEHFRHKWNHHGGNWARRKHRLAGGATMRLVRYADDFVVMVKGQHHHAQALWEETSQVLAPLGLKLSPEKTRVVHINDGFDFLGWHIQRRQKKSAPGRRYIYTYPSKKALTSIKDTVRDITCDRHITTLGHLLGRLNPALKGWCAYFSTGVSSSTFSYLEYYVFGRIYRWLHRQHPKLNKHTLVAKHMPQWHIQDGKTELFRPSTIPTTRYRYRGQAISTPWTQPTPA